MEEGSLGVVQIAPLLPGCCADRPFIARALAEAEECERKSKVKTIDERTAELSMGLMNSAANVRSVLLRLAADHRCF